MSFRLWCKVALSWGVWVLLLVALGGCSRQDAPVVDEEGVRLEQRLAQSLDAYCDYYEYREDICAVQLPQGFGR